jgi:adenosylcobinamide-GDP ribazoletransferase
VIAIGVYWKLRLGGMTGDCLGASIEATETALLFVLAVSAV